MTERIDVDCLYTNGDSWVWGSELIDPFRPDITDHFHTLHDYYRKKHMWPTVLAERLSLEPLGGGYPGASNERILRTSIYDLAKLKAQGRRPLALIAWTQLQRFDLADHGGTNFRSFVGPGDHDLPRCVKDIWAHWSSDYCDLVRWLTQLVSLHSFCRLHDIPVMGLTVFRKPYQILEQHIDFEEFKPYKELLSSVCDLSSQYYQFSLESILRQYTGIDYGPGGHPLQKGHLILAKNLEKILRQRFTINEPNEANQLHS